MKKHWVIDVKTKGRLQIGGVYHTEKQKNDRLNELQEGGFPLKDIEVKVYIQD